MADTEKVRTAYAGSYPLAMKPPIRSLDEYCECSGGNHVRRVLPIPETPEEEALIARYDNAYYHPDKVELAEAIERFMRDGVTAENLEWALGPTARTLDRWYADGEKASG